MPQPAAFVSRGVPEERSVSVPPLAPGGSQEPVEEYKNRATM